MLALVHAVIATEYYGATLTMSWALAVRCSPDPVTLGFVPKNAYGSLGRCLLPDKSFRRIRPRAQYSHSHWSKKRGPGLSDWHSEEICTRTIITNFSSTRQDYEKVLDRTYKRVLFRFLEIDARIILAPDASPA